MADDTSERSADKSSERNDAGSDVQASRAMSNESWDSMRQDASASNSSLRSDSQANNSTAAEHLPTVELTDTRAPQTRSASGDLQQQTGFTKKQFPDNPTNPTDLEYRERLQAGPTRQDTPCNTEAQSPSVSGKEIQNTCDVDLKTQYPQVKDSIVRIERPQGGNTGTGFLACDDKKCEIVTNDHVVGDESQVRLSRDGQPGSAIGQVTKRDPENDLATISFNRADLPGLKPVTMGEPGALQAGSPVFGAGHGAGLPEQSVMPGQIKSPSNEVGVRGKNDEAQFHSDWFTAEMKGVSGHSGSPVFNAQGELVGVAGSSNGKTVSGPKADKVKELLKRGN